MDFRGFDSSATLSLRGGIPRPKGDFPESSSKAMLVGCNVSKEIGVPLLIGAARPIDSSLVGAARARDPHVQMIA